MKPGQNSPEAQKLVTDFATARGLKTGGSAEFRDQYSIEADPGLAVLTARAGQTNPLTGQATPAKYGRRFFFDQSAQGREVPSSTFYKPQAFPTFDQLPLHLVWRTTEQVAEPLRDPNSAEAKAKVEAAWKRKQARDLAKKAAEDLAKKAEALGSNPVELLPKLTQLQAEFAAAFADSAARDRVKSFTLDNVAPVVERAGVGIMAQKAAGGFQLVPSDDTIPYPTSPMATALVDNKDKPIGTAVVTTDAPGDTAYVAVLVNRQEKSIDEFHINVYSSFAAQSLLKPLLTRNHSQALRQEERGLGVALLKSEYGYTNENPSVTKRSNADE